MLWPLPGKVIFTDVLFKSVEHSLDVNRDYGYKDYWLLFNLLLVLLSQIVVSSCEVEKHYCCS